ncbi:nucleoside/nucleotide kinase family protein [Butyrivibrio sp. XPD2002]|uniref:nucleoside/nucleotide kinase family protein n=1 Tax=Butyrivibrio sp. XPD2002 TaxID=1280665 RepID=UPI0003FCFF14|nr:nucleoside/nucleotide kinase family protein [Butyrivibrio sp. XPD2002]
MKYSVNINGIDVDAKYSEYSVSNIFIPLISKLSSLQRAKGKRILVLLAAPPGAGKSTLCSFLQKLSEGHDEYADIQAIGMDGFHRRQEYLLTHNVMRDGQEVRMVDIKGAPITFDLELLKKRIQDVLSSEVTPWPTYDRHLHNPIDNAITVEKNIVLLEGNYLLLDEDGWREIKDYADYTISITADENMLRSRLVDRKVKSGNTLEAAEKFVDYSDMANVRLCLEKTMKADLALRVNQDGDCQLPRT